MAQYTAENFSFVFFDYIVNPSMSVSLSLLKETVSLLILPYSDSHIYCVD